MHKHRQLARLIWCVNDVFLLGSRSSLFDIRVFHSASVCEVFQSAINAGVYIRARC